MRSTSTDYDAGRTEPPAQDKDGERLDLLIDLFDRHLIPLSLHELRMQFERIKAGKLPAIRKASK